MSIQERRNGKFIERLCASCGEWKQLLQFESAHLCSRTRRGKCSKCRYQDKKRRKAQG